MQELKKLVDRSFFVVPQFEESWTEVFVSFFIKKEMTKSITQIFPLLEHSLRRIFSVSLEDLSKLMTSSSSSFNMSPVLRCVDDGGERIFELVGNDNFVNIFLMFLSGKNLRKSEIYWHMEC